MDFKAYVETRGFSRQFPMHAGRFPCNHQHDCHTYTNCPYIRGMAFFTMPHRNHSAKTRSRRMPVDNNASLRPPPQQPLLPRRISILHSRWYSLVNNAATCCVTACLMVRARRILHVHDAGLVSVVCGAGFFKRSVGCQVHFRIVLMKLRIERASLQEGSGLQQEVVQQC